jgi:hypothetical protein
LFFGHGVFGLDLQQNLNFFPLPHPHSE